MSNQNYPKYPPGVGGQYDKKNKKRDPNRQYPYPQQNRNKQPDRNQNDNYQMDNNQDIGNLLNILAQHNPLQDQFAQFGYVNNDTADDQEIQFVNVNDLEENAFIQNNNIQSAPEQQPEQEESQKSKEFISKLNEALQKKSDAIIEIGKSKIDEMDNYIECKIQERICNKIIEQLCDKEKTIFKEVFEDQLLNKQFLRDQIISNMEEHFRDYFQEVAKVYDLGLKHFVEYCKESEVISKINKEKCQQIILEMETISDGDKNILSKLQEQTKDEQEELNNMKMINETIAKYTQGIAVIKERNIQLEALLVNLQQKMNERIKQNKQIAEVMAQKYLEEYTKALVTQKKVSQRPKMQEEDTDDEGSQEEETRNTQRSQVTKSGGIKPPVQIITKQTTLAQQQQQPQPLKDDSYFKDEESDDEEEEEEEDEEIDEQLQQNLEKIQNHHLKNLINDDDFEEEDQRGTASNMTKHDRNKFRQNYKNDFGTQIKHNEEESDDEDSISDS